MPVTNDDLTAEQRLWVKRMEAHLRLYGRQNGPLPEAPDWGLAHRRRKQGKVAKQEGLDF